MDFDFTSLARGLAVLSLGGIGVMLAGSFLWPQAAEQYKKQIQNVIIGIILVGIAAAIIGYL